VLLGALVSGLVANVSPAAAQTTGQDSLTVTGVAGNAPRQPFSFGDLDIHASSGPSGETPTGRALIVVTSPGPGNIPIGSQTTDNVTCLAVSGNSAVVGFRDLVTNTGQWVGQFSDNGPANSGLDRFSLTLASLRAPSDCSPLGPDEPIPLVSGDIVIHDAPALPTSKDQCKNDGWRNFPQFKNQGQCVAFVERGSNG
jgi:hypothetical protein